MANPLQSVLPHVHSAWGELMADVRDEIHAARNGRYPQLNLNTGMSVATVVLLLGIAFWFAGVKSDVGYHEQRLAIVESGLRDLRLAQGQAETKLEGRLTRIEILLQDVLNRMADRDRRQGP